MMTHAWMADSQHVLLTANGNGMQQNAIARFCRIL